METHPSTQDLDELLGQMPWVERLALGLVQDPHTARDVAQEAYAMALERPPRNRRGPGLRAWLARVTRTLARQHSRGENRRRYREQAAARDHGSRSTPAPDEVVARGALHERVVHAVLALEEPYSSCVLLRYLDGAETAEIARRTGTTPVAVRKRLSRALEMLRGRLATELEDEGGLPCLLALIPAARRPPVGLETGGAASAGATGSTTLALGGALMAPALRLAIPLVLLTGGMLYLAFEGDSSTPTPGQATPALAHATLTGLMAEEEGTNVAERIRVPSSAEESNDVAPREARSSLQRIHARLLDARGWPLPDGELLLGTAPGGSGFRGGRLRFAVEGEGRSEQAREYRSEPCDANGDVWIHVEPGEDLPWIEEDEVSWLPFVARAGGHGAVGWYERAPGSELLELGDIRLSPTGTVAGRVTDEDGLPVPDAFVWVTVPSQNPMNTRGRRYHGPDDLLAKAMENSDAEGLFHFDELKAGTWRVWTGKAGYEWTSSALLEVAPDRSIPTLELQLRELPADRRIDGRVLDPQGQPVEDIYVARAAPLGTETIQDFGWVATTEADGGFVFTVADPSLFDLRVWDRRGRYTPFTLRGVVPGTGSLVLTVEEPQRVKFTCTDPEGRPVEMPNARFRVVGEGRTHYFWQPRKGPVGVTNAVLPDAPFDASVHADGYLPVELGTWTPEEAPQEMEVELRRPARVHGQVLAGGRHLAGANVQLVRVQPKGHVDIVSGFESRLNGFGLEGTRTDAEGRFELGVFFEDRYVVFVEAKGWAAAELGPFDLDPEHGKEVDAVLSRGGAIEGQVIPVEGESAAGITVRAARGDMRVHAARTGKDGRYRIEGLTAGPWIVRARRQRQLSSPGGMLGMVQQRTVVEDYELPWDCEVLEGETTRFDVDLAKMDIGRIEGRFVLDGEPVDGARVRILATGGAWSWKEANGPGVRTDPAGAFVLEKIPIGKHWVVLEAERGPLRGVRVILEREVLRGDQRMDVDLVTAPLEIEFGTRPQGGVAVIARPRPGWTMVQPITVDATGVARLERAIVGTGTVVQGLGGGKDADPLGWEPVGSVEVVAGEANRGSVGDV